MTKLWSTTSLVALGLLGCLTWTNVEALKKVSPSTMQSEIQMSYILWGISLLLCPLSVLFSSTLTNRLLDKTLNHITQRHHTFIIHLRNSNGPRKNQMHLKLKSRLVTFQHPIESHVESRPFLLTTVRHSAAAMSPDSAFLENQVGFLRVLYYRVCVLCKYNHNFLKSIWDTFPKTCLSGWLNPLLSLLNVMLLSIFNNNWQKALNFICIFCLYIFIHLFM